jgi:hypothetical protein
VRLSSVVNAPAHLGPTPCAGTRHKACTGEEVLHKIICIPSEESLNYGKTKKYSLGFSS